MAKQHCRKAAVALTTDEVQKRSRAAETPQHLDALN